MKTLSSALWVILLLGTSALADPVVPAREKSRGKLVFVTGSLIPQRLELRALGSTTTSPLRIIGRPEIDGTGRLTIPGVLLTDPTISVTGR